MKSCRCRWDFFINLNRAKKRQMKKKDAYMSIFRKENPFRRRPAMKHFRRQKIFLMIHILRLIVNPGFCHLLCQNCLMKGIVLSSSRKDFRSQGWTGMPVRRRKKFSAKSARIKALIPKIQVSRGL